MLTEEIEKCMYDIKNTRNNVGIVAPAGTGKTTLIRDLVENDHNKKYMVKGDPLVGLLFFALRYPAGQDFCKDRANRLSSCS